MARAYDIVNADVIVVVYNGWQQLKRFCSETQTRRRWTVPMQEASDIRLDSDLHD